jgi:hypothetical protein
MEGFLSLRTNTQLFQGCYALQYFNESNNLKSGKLAHILPPEARLNEAKTTDGNSQNV